MSVVRVLPFKYEMGMLNLSTNEQDARNIARILIELAKRGVRLQINTTINPNKRWPWMGRRGKILDNYH